MIHRLIFCVCGLLFWTTSLVGAQSKGSDLYSEPFTLLVCDTKLQIMTLSALPLLEPEDFEHSLSMVNGGTGSESAACGTIDTVAFAITDQYQSIMIGPRAYLICKVVIRALWVGHPIVIHPYTQYALIPFGDVPA